MFWPLLATVVVLVVVMVAGALAQAGTTPAQAIADLLRRRRPALSHGALLRLQASQAESLRATWDGAVGGIAPMVGELPTVTARELLVGEGPVEELPAVAPPVVDLGIVGADDPREADERELWRTLRDRLGPQ